MSIVITSATGKLGGLTVDALLQQDIEPSSIVAAGRNTQRLEMHRAKGVRTAHFDAESPDTFSSAFANAKKVMLISIPGNPHRLQQHRAAIDAAEAADVELLTYVSYVHADICTVEPRDIIGQHFQTEQFLHKGSLPHVVLRNGLYFTFLMRQIPIWREQGRILGAFGEGKISAADHNDLAQAAAAILTSPKSEKTTYELGIDDAFTMAEFAAELSRQTNEDIPYVDVSFDELVSRLRGNGLTEIEAERRASIDRSVSNGEVFIDVDDLRRLVDRPLTTLADAVTRALREPTSLHGRRLA